MENPDDLLCKKFIENPSKNPRSGRTIGEGKGVYNGLVKLCVKRNFDVSSLKVPSNISLKKLIPSTGKELTNKSPTIMNIKMLLSDLSPNDLLDLYISDVTIEKTLDTKDTVDLLNIKYNINVNTDSYITWYKSYIMKNINPNIIYLYDMEKY